MSGVICHNKDRLYSIGNRLLTLIWQCVIVQHLKKLPGGHCEKNFSSCNGFRNFVYECYCKEKSQTQKSTKNMAPNESRAIYNSRTFFFNVFVLVPLLGKKCFSLPFGM